MNPTIYRFLLWVSVLLVVLVGAPALASAHTIGLSRARFVASDAGVDAEIQLARSDALALAPWLDADHDGAITQGEVTLGGERFAEETFARIAVTRPSARGAAESCTLTQTSATLAEEDGLIAHGTYACVSPHGGIAIDATVLLDALPRGHRAVAHLVTSGLTEPLEALLHRGAATFRAEATTAAEAAPAPRSIGAILAAYFVLGVEHILTGVDHVVFLLGLILLGGRWRSILWMVTAFTVAHSITLGLAVLGVVAPSGRIVEPLIALSVAYVGVENFIVRDVDKRWRITALFGLVHGFGFAGALGEIALPRAEIPVALLSFNVGVEVGQLGLLLVALPLVLKLRERSWFRERGVQLASAALVVAGVIWFVTRVAQGV